MEFYESFMKFSFADSDVFCIEADPLVVNSTGLKACECVVLLSPRVAFIEAKASAPKEVASSAFMDEIKRKFADSLRLFNEIKSNMAMRHSTVFLFVLGNFLSTPKVILFV